MSGSDRQDGLFDQRGHDFFTVDNAFIDVHGPVVGAYGIAVYTILVRHADKNGAAFPSRGTIARLAKCSVKTVDRTLVELASAGLVSKVGQTSAAGDSDVNLYTLKRVTRKRRDSQSRGGDSQSLPVGTHSPQGGDSQSPKQDPYEQDPLEQVPSNDGRGANDAPDEVAPLAPADIPAGGPSPAKVRKPRAPKTPDPLAVLAENIMLDTTGRMSAPDRRHAGLVWPLVGDIRAMVGDNPPAAVQVWMAFCDAQRDSGQWQYVQAHNARDRFGRWAANGGGAAIEQAKAMFGGVGVEGGQS